MGAIQIVARLFTHPDDASLVDPPLVKRVKLKRNIFFLPQPSFRHGERVIQRSADRVS
jgi:hypothetical protein